MDLQKAIEENTKALRALTEVLRAGSPAPVANEPARGATAPEPAAPEPAAPVTEATLRAAALAFAKEHGKPALVARFEEFGATKLAEVAPENYGSLLAVLSNG